MALSSADQPESQLTTLNITCSICSTPQPIETVPAAKPFHQLTCEQCETNLVVVNADAADSGDSTNTLKTTVDNPIHAPVPTQRAVATVALFLINLTLFSFALYGAFQSLKMWYDPWDLHDPPYAPVILTAMGWSPLHLAAGEGDEQRVKTLLASGADLHARNGQNNTPLHEAVKRGHLAVVSELLEHKSPVDAIGNEEMTPLHMAATNEHTDVIKILIANGARVNLTATDRKTTALHMAADEGNAETVAVLLASKADVNARNASKETPLHTVAQHTWQDETDVATLLLEHGADLDARDDHGFAPLNRAAREGNHHLAKLLVAHGVDVESQTVKGTTPLHQAAWADDLELVRLLLDHDARINTRNIEGFTPLMTAAKRGHADVVRLLLDRGADPNLRTDGKTALEYALESQCGEKARTFWTWSIGMSKSGVRLGMNSQCEHASVHVLREHGSQVYDQLRNHIVRGGELSKQHQYTQALEEQSQAITLAPQDADLYYQRALTHVCLNAFPAAQQDLQKAIGLNPTYFEAYHQLTYVLAQLRLWEESVHHWDRLIAIAPKHARARYERGFVTLNKIDRTPSDREQALADLSLSCQYGYQEACTAHEQAVRRSAK